MGGGCCCFAELFVFRGRRRHRRRVLSPLRLHSGLRAVRLHVCPSGIVRLFGLRLARKLFAASPLRLLPEWADHDPIAVTTAMTAIDGILPPPAFEILNRTFVLFGCGVTCKCSEISPLAGLGVELARIKPECAGAQFADHWKPLRQRLLSKFWLFKSLRFKSLHFKFWPS